VNAGIRVLTIWNFSTTEEIPPPGADVPSEGNGSSEKASPNRKGTSR
jgi:hypothetical protein